MTHTTHPAEQPRNMTPRQALRLLESSLPKPRAHTLQQALDALAAQTDRIQALEAAVDLMRPYLAKAVADNLMTNCVISPRLALKRIDQWLQGGDNHV